MPTLHFQLRNPDDAHVEDAWRIYYAFIGRYYQRPVDSQFGISMCRERPHAWAINFTEEECKEIVDVALKCNVFNTIFKVYLTCIPTK